MVLAFFSRVRMWVWVMLVIFIIAGTIAGVVIEVKKYNERLRLQLLEEERKEMTDRELKKSLKQGSRTLSKLHALSDKLSKGG